ncbi:MAG: Formation of crista junctions protein 1 [Thelocarpon superellum]|nr:MAG: Formation of crista junctions protein 1 [Thelocarpon superellum]
MLTRAMQRYSADARQPERPAKRSIADSKPAVLPGSSSTTLDNKPPPPPGLAPNPSSSTSGTPPTPAPPSTIPPSKVPLTPPPPPMPLSPKSPSGISPPPPPPLQPSPPSRKPRRFRRYLISLILLNILGYGGGVYYTLVSDRWHDFFTEYIPYAEDVVGYFEDQQFRRRFPDAARRVLERPRDTGTKVTIPGNSGLSWKVTDGPKPGDGKGPSSASDAPGSAKQHPQQATPAAKTEAAPSHSPEAPDASSSQAPVIAKAAPVKADTNRDLPKPVAPSKKEAATPAAAKEAGPQDSPKAPPLPRIDPLKIKDADEPLVQDLVKIINDIIAVVNADNASGKYSTAIDSAKSQLKRVGQQIKGLSTAAQKSAEEKIRESHQDFDRAAKELVRRLEDEMREQETRWRDDFESEREKIAQSYQDKLRVELARSQEVADQRLRNQLLEQAIDMKRQFAADIRDRVEHERDGRLSKLSDLSGSVTELEKLTSEWTSVVDANLKTQHLHVAIDAVRAKIEDAAQPRPFIRELAALKEIAANDDVVGAAINSVNPTTYHYGVPSTAQLVDRFRRVAAEVRKASLLPANAGIASHAASAVLSRLMFRKQGLVAGEDVESILTRSEVLLQEGDLDGAAREMNTLTGWAKTLSQDWLTEVRRVLEVNQAMDVITTEARLQSLLVD